MDKPLSLSPQFSSPETTTTDDDDDDDNKIYLTDKKEKVISKVRFDKQRNVKISSE